MPKFTRVPNNHNPVSEFDCHFEFRKVEVPTLNGAVVFVTSALLPVFNEPTTNSEAKVTIFMGGTTVIEGHYDVWASLINRSASEKERKV